jgi:uncharacterized repeat protein (TIGR03847 family)
MSPIDLDLNPCDRLTADAIGQPGKRVFYLQGWQGQRTVTLLIEKIQLQTLAVGIEQFMVEIQERLPHLAEAPADYVEEHMHIHPPVDPLFRVGEIALGYEAETDLVVLIARELLGETSETGEAEEAAEEAGVVRFWCTRAQARALASWGMAVSGRGRPTCPQCGEPINPEGHLCPKKNGHKH